MKRKNIELSHCCCRLLLLSISQKLNRVREYCHPDSLLFEHFFLGVPIESLRSPSLLKLPPHMEPQPVIAVMLYPNPS